MLEVGRSMFDVRIFFFIDPTTPPSDPWRMPLIQDGLYCPACGYDLRGLSSDRCPECGLTIDATRSGIIPWERRKSLGYFQSFFRTLVKATVSPTRLARATGSPMDVRSARLFRWIVRVLVIVPVVALFIFAVARNGGIDALATVGDPARVSLGGFWEPLFLWTVGATLWPVLPIGFVFSIILATGISHWFFMKRLESARRNRAMALSFYLSSPLGWILFPCCSFAAALILSNRQWVDISSMIESMTFLCECIGGLSLFLMLLATGNSLRAVHSATQCGLFRALIVGLGVTGQAVASCAMGLLLFPAIVGLFRLMITSLWR
jgi:hypothetical protein